MSFKKRTKNYVINTIPILYKKWSACIENDQKEMYQSLTIIFSSQI